MIYQAPPPLLLTPRPLPNPRRRRRALLIRLLLLRSPARTPLRSAARFLLPVRRRSTRRSSLLGRTRRPLRSAAGFLRVRATISVRGGIGLSFLARGRARAGAVGFVFLLLVAVLRGGAGGFFLVDLQLRRVFHHVVAWAGHVDRRVVGLRGFLDRVAAFGLDGEFAFGFLLRDFAAGLGAVPGPGDCVEEREGRLLVKIGPCVGVGMDLEQGREARKMFERRMRM